MSVRDLYAVLGVAPSATPDEIKRAFRRLASQHHPDKNASEGSAATFKEINAAWQVLRDPQTRAEYDQAELHGDGSPSTADHLRAPPVPASGDELADLCGEVFAAYDVPTTGSECADIAEELRELLTPAAGSPRRRRPR